MKVLVDGKEVFELNATKEKVIKNDIDSDVFAADMERRLKWVLAHKYERCMNRLKDEWEPRLKANGLESIPLDEDALAELIFSQPDYKNRSQRDLEQRNLEELR